MQAPMKDGVGGWLQDERTNLKPNIAAKQAKHEAEGHKISDQNSNKSTRMYFCTKECMWSFRLRSLDEQNMHHIHRTP
jgi:hypothetical protein